MEQSPIATELLDPEGQIVQVNTAWLRLWDVNEGEAAQVLENRNILNDKQIEDLGIMPLVKRAFTGENIVLPPIEYDANITSEETGLEGIEARATWIQCHLYPVWDANGDVAYVVNTYMDLTDLKQAEQEAQEQRESLARVDRTTRMGQLAGSIAHELNQPLTGILSTAQAGEIMVKRGQCEPDEMAEVLAAIAADAKRAGRVIHSLRELYRDQKRDLEPVDVNDVINETVLLMHSELIKQHVQVTTRCTSSASMVKGNRVQIQQVLLNLIMNGNQAMSGMAQEDRHLHLETACDEKEVRVWVQDSGPGIDADKIDRIFEPLTTWKSGGTGMGLAMSQSIVRTHQGRMWAENRPEGGARVGFILPLLEEEQQA
jgi:C4-dicarboxylate-specific signal transduction histidine kinase